MKIALLICGQARLFRKGYETIKDLISKYDSDIYIHTWKNASNIFETAQCLSHTITEQDLYEYITLYNPTKFKIEEELSKEYIDSRLKRKIYEYTSAPQTKYNFFSYLYSLEQCFKLVENKNEYDNYIILRSDAVIKAFPNLFDMNIREPRILIYDRLPTRFEVIDTMCTVIPKEYIDIYADLINHLDEYYDKGYMYNYEELMLAHLKESGLLKHILRLSSNEFCFALWRENDRIEHF